MPIYLGNNKLKELYIGGNKIKEAYLGSIKVFSSAVGPSYEIWTNDTKTYTCSNNTSFDVLNLNVPASTDYNYVLLEYDAKMRIISGNLSSFGGIAMYISPADYSNAIEFKFDGSSSSFTYSYIFGLTSIFTAWTNSNIISTTGTGQDYSGNYRYVRNGSYFSSLNTWYKVRYIFDQANKKLYFYFGNNKVYMGYANLNMLSGEIVNKIWLYSADNMGGWGSPSEVSIKNIKCGGFPTLQAAIDY